MLMRIEHDVGVVELRMERPPVNALDPELVNELHAAIAAAPGEGAHALVLSGTEGIFSAGLDVPVLMQLKQVAMDDFWRKFISLLQLLATLPIPIIAAITGHSPAGGAVLAIFCDSRVAAEGPFKIGLNEVQVGLPVPAIIYGALKRLLGPHPAERLCLHGLLVSPSEALEIGLVDRVMPPDQVLPAALEWCYSLLNLPPQAVRTTRRQARDDLAQLFEQLGDRSHEELMRVWYSAETQAAMRAMVAQLSAHKV